MLKRLCFLLLLFSFCQIGMAASFVTVPYTFVARQLISASKVMANYNALKNAIVDGSKKINVAELWINGVKRINSSGILIEDNIYKVPGEYSTVALAITAIGSATANIEIDTVTTETSGLEFPSNIICLKFGALGKIGGTVTATFNNQRIDAPVHQQVFGGNLTMVGTISNTSYAKWFGATGDGTTDDTAELNSWLGMAGNLHLTTGNYLVSSALTIYSNTKLFGEGRIFCAENSEINLLETNYSNTVYANNIDISGITLDHNRKVIGTAQIAMSLLIVGADNVTVEKVKFVSPNADCIYISTHFGAVGNY